MEDEVEKVLDAAVGAVQRMAIEIVALPAFAREDGLGVAERALNKVMSRSGMRVDRACEFVRLEMGALRALVREIEITGGAIGGAA